MSARHRWRPNGGNPRAVRVARLQDRHEAFLAEQQRRNRPIDPEVHHLLSHIKIVHRRPGNPGVANGGNTPS